jgi:hypothetical protein
VWHPDASITSQGDAPYWLNDTALSRHILTCTVAHSRGTSRERQKIITQSLPAQLTCGQLALLYSRFIYLFLSLEAKGCHSCSRRSGVGGSQKDLALPTGPCAPRQLLLRAPLTDSAESTATAQGCGIWRECAALMSSDGVVARCGSHEARAKVDAVFALSVSCIIKVLKCIIPSHDWKYHCERATRGHWLSMLGTTFVWCSSGSYLREDSNVVTFCKLQSGTINIKGVVRRIILFENVLDEAKRLKEVHCHQWNQNRTAS